MQQSRIFILLGHTLKEGTTGSLADAYESGALEAGHEVRRMNIGEMQFDPILHHGYRTIQELEPDLKTFQENIRWCTHFVLLYPDWWSTTPAIVKGLFDRAWLPAFAFRFNKNGMGWQKLLKGRSARIIIPANTPGWLSFCMFGESTNTVARAMLGFSGFSPVRIKVFSPSEKASDAVKESWKKKVTGWGRRAD